MNEAENLVSMDSIEIIYVIRGHRTQAERWDRTAKSARDSGNVKTAILAERQARRLYDRIRQLKNHADGRKPAATKTEGDKHVGISDVLERKGYDRLWLWFGISRSSWITLPRVLAHEMPDGWQDKMAALLEEYEATYTNWPDGIGTRVQITDSGHLTACHNWLHNYRYPAKGKIETLRSNG